MMEAMTVSVVKASDLIAKWRYALANGWGYIWGRYGQVWTQANQNAATREMTVKYGQKWVGKHVADCSGLGYWAFKEMGGYIYHGSNTIWNQYVTCRCELKNGKRTDGAAMLPGDPVFKRKTVDGKINRHHIGYFVGGDTVIEAKGTQSGVVSSKLSAWHETAHWIDVEYEGGQIFVGYPTLKRGSSGESVKRMQELLINAGYSVGAAGADGIFGSGTESGLIAFQADHGLIADGICGPKTWEALSKDEQQTPEPDKDTDIVTVGRDELEIWADTLETLVNEIRDKLGRG